MTISGSLANSLSGLTAASRAAELVSSNVANAMTEGYGRREVVLTPRSMGDGTAAGVNVTGVRREVDNVLLQNRRLADAGLGHGNTVADFHNDLEQILGTPDQAGSLTARFAQLEASLIEAASRPDNPARLSAVVQSAGDLAQQFNSASQRIQTLRMEADTAIAAQVGTLNETLERVQNLNYQIKESLARGQDPSPLMDLRDQSIDSISDVLPLRQVPREDGMIALFTTGGAIVLDGRAGTFSFENVGVIVPEMTQSSGALSGLTLNGNALRTGGDRSPIQGGTLAALFEVRDELATAAQSRLDAVARDLVERFQDPALDATRAPGTAGLFTDSGAVFDTADEVGLSSRLALSPQADPAQGGAAWRLRDGLGAAVPGEVGNPSLLHELRAALTEARAPASGGFSGAARSAAGLAADFLSLTSSERVSAERQQSFSAAEQESLSEAVLSSGVDTDHEMQKLMLIEQAFAANAKVMTTVGEMLDALMRI